MHVFQLTGKHTTFGLQENAWPENFLPAATCCTIADS